MKKSLIAVIGVAAVAALGIGGYSMYTKQAEEKAFEEKMADTLMSIEPITVYEKQELPSVEQVFEGTSDMIDISSVVPDISNVYTTEPGAYEVNYSFNDINGTPRTVTVPCIVKADLLSHVSGFQNITIDAGDPVPTDSGCTFDDYVESVSINTGSVDASTPGIYDITYTVLGADGELTTAEGYTCTVNAVPTPSPTPTPKPTSTPKLTPSEDEPEKTEQTEKKTKKKTKKNKKKTTSQETETETQTETEAPAVGNVEQTGTAAAETGDTSNIVFWIAAVLLGLAAAAGAGIYLYKKQHDNSKL